MVSYKIISDSPSPFPAITICNLNPFDFGTYESTGIYLQNIIFNNSLNSKIELSENDTAIVKIDEIRNIIKAHATSDKSLSFDQLRNKGFTLNTMLVSCFYNNEECFLNDFHLFRDNDFGNCYTFNDIFDGNRKIKDTLKTSKSGLENGLKMEIFVGISGKQDFFSIKKGTKVAIHQRGVRPLLKYDGIELSTGIASNIAISRTNYSQEPPPYSKCRSNPNTFLSDDSVYHSYTLSISKYYQKLCYEICLQYEQIVPNCDCADPSIPIVNFNFAICNNKTSLNCVKKQRDFFDLNKNIDEVCGKFCPSDCEQITYSTSISQSIYPTDYYSNILALQNNLLDKFNPPILFNPVDRKEAPIPDSKNSINETAFNDFLTSDKFNSQTNQSLDQGKNIKKPPGKSDLSSSVLMLSIFYENLQYTYIKESPAMEFDTMLGLIGGQFGLFMGASFLSFIEILEMVINLIRSYAKYKIEKNKINLKFQSN